MYRGLFLVLAVLLLLPLFSHASVIIHEIAWMGTENSANDEWLELYNSGPADVLLDGWMLKADDGQPNISLVGSIPAGGYFLLERTDDESVPGITADLIYTGALGNSGEVLLLKDASTSVVDEVNAVSGWPAGDNTTKETMQRLNVGSWITDAGTPRAAHGGADPPSPPEADLGGQSNTNGPSASNDNYVPPEKMPRITAYAGKDKKAIVGEEIYFEGSALGFEGTPLENARYLWSFGDAYIKEGKIVSHIYIFPSTYTARLSIASGQYTAFDDLTVSVTENSVSISEAAPGTDGWIELENVHSEPVTISNWVLKNVKGSRFAFPAGTIIAPKSFVVFPAGTTGITLEGADDVASLFYPNGTVAEERAVGELYGASPTPGVKNDSITREVSVSRVTPPAAPAGREEESLPPTPVKKNMSQLQLPSSTAAAAGPTDILRDGTLQHFVNSELSWLFISIAFGVFAASAVIMYRRVRRIP